MKLEKEGDALQDKYSNEENAGLISADEKRRAGESGGDARQTSWTSCDRKVCRAEPRRVGPGFRKRTHTRRPARPHTRAAIPTTPHVAILKTTKNKCYT